jgi:hypothetical protein
VGGWRSENNKKGAMMSDPIEDIELVRLRKHYEALGGEERYADIFALLATVERSRATIDFMIDKNTRVLQNNRESFEAGFKCGLREKS